jgi:methyl-accepting chemotaxis protein
MSFKNLKIKQQMLLSIALLTLIAAGAVGVGLMSMLHYNQLAYTMEKASGRAVVGERVNSAVLSVVMDSRGIYMSSTAADVEKYGVPLLKSLDKARSLMAEWRNLLPPERQNELDAASAKVEEFIKYRSELVRLAREVSYADARAYGDNDANRANRKALNDLILGLADRNNEEVAAARGAMEAYFKQQRLILIGLLALGIPLALLVTFQISVRLIVSPIRNMTSTMGALAGGNLDLHVAGTDQANEIGDMARAVEIFRSGLSEARKLGDAEKEAQKIKEQRVARMDELIRAFDTGIENVLLAINDSSIELERTAASLSAMAEESSRSASSVAAASEEATTNVQAVASSSRRMTESLQEVIHEIGVSRNATDSAASEARETAVIAAGLIEATKKIDDVVTIIQDIASQTNLLALNATIEAARAGDAGKGFAVVANEVKNLATQTASSTEQIAEQVGSVQTVSAQVVDAIGKICETIQRVSEMSNSVASHVAAQGNVTEEISLNIAEAAQGTKEVTVNISNVSQGASETGESAHQLLEAAKDIARQSTLLRAQVEGFLGDIKSI